MRVCGSKRLVADRRRFGIGSSPCLKDLIEVLAGWVFTVSGICRPSGGRFVGRRG